MTSKTKTLVWITTQFESSHCWPQAPDEVSFLRYPHRHIFHVKLGVQVEYDDRDVEFITLKREVNQFLHEAKLVTYTSPYFGKFGHTASCETMARTLLERFAADFVEVSEDGENGCKIEKI